GWGMAGRKMEPIPVDDRTTHQELASVPPQPTLDDLSPEASGRIVRYIVTSALEHGVAPTAVIALYADLTGDELAVRYADRRFMLREVPPDWREGGKRGAGPATSAHQRGLGPAAARRRPAPRAPPRP